MFTKRLQGIAQHINDHHDVEGLRRRIRSRAQKMVDNQGGRFNKWVSENTLPHDLVLA